MGFATRNGIQIIIIIIIFSNIRKGVGSGRKMGQQGEGVRGGGRGLAGQGRGAGGD